ncbi:MAG: allantoate amidohydrolase [Burkholderiaceae bacterium]|nr:allantoate amidohydrolase [Burkholderiaceae bacterium]
MERKHDGHGRDAPRDGHRVMAWADALAAHSDRDGELTLTYCTPAHLACAQAIGGLMREAGFDSVERDAVGNVVGRYRGTAPDAHTLLTGSHFDTVRNGGRYDGRLGILVPIAAVARLAAAGRRPSFDLEVIAFAEEEGVRFRSTFLGSSAVAGRFDTGVLETRDADGISMAEAMRGCGLDPSAIPALARDPSRLIGFIEVHIEQGPVLLGQGLALGVVTSINGGVRRMIEIEGLAGHAGTTPMTGRHDAACAAAEIVLAIETRCAREPGLVGTVGQLEVPNGSTNVIAARCRLSIDVRAPVDAQRDAALADIDREIASICARRGVTWRSDEVMRAAAAPSDPGLMRAWSRALESIGLPAFALPSGAGHDAMMMASLCPQAMLFVRCGHGGISHNPRETIRADDAQLAVDAFVAMLDQLDAAAVARAPDPAPTETGPT